MNERHGDVEGAVNAAARKHVGARAAASVAMIGASPRRAS
jgi:hypothetical protein